MYVHKTNCAALALNENVVFLFCNDLFYLIK